MVIGHTRQIQLLDLHMRTNTWSHAYLFTGARHVGKLTVARRAASALLCEKKNNSKSALAACGACSACRSFAAGTHPDVFILDTEETGEASIHIEEIRRMRERLGQTAYGGIHMVFIRDAARMTREAANAFLKVLEEPRGPSLFFLVSRSAEDVLGTIRSRAWHIRFWPVSEEMLMAGLSMRGILHKRAEALVRIAGGFPGEALRLHGEPEAALEKAESEQQHVVSLLRASIAERLAYAEMVHDNTDHMQAWYAKTIAALRNLVHASLYKERVDHVVLSAAGMCRVLMEGEERFGRPQATKRIVFENSMMNLSRHEN